MTFILQRYKVLILAILGLMIIAAAAWSITSKAKAGKIPSRGVFVMQSEKGEFKENAENNNKTGICQVC